MPLLKGLSLATVTFYTPHLIFLLYKIGQSLFSPATKLYLYEVVCRFELGDEAVDGSLTVGCGNDTGVNGTDKVDCDNLIGENEDLIQRSAADYIMAMKILQDVPGFILGMYCGGWIDRVGRRLPMMITCLGGTVVALLFTFVQAAHFTVQYAIIAVVLVGIAINAFCGRNTLVTMAIQAYVADQTTDKERTRQLGFILAMNFFGLFSGSLIMAVMADVLPFWAMFLCVAICYSTAFVLIFFALSDRKKPKSSEKEASKLNPDSKVDPPKAEKIGEPRQSIVSQTSIASLRMNLGRKLLACFRLSNLTDTVKTLTRKRPNNMRLFLILTYVCIILQNVCKAGEVDVLLLFVKHHPLNWSKAAYAYLLSVQYATVAMLLLVVLPFLVHVIRLTDTSIIIWCTLAKTAGLITMAYADRSWMVVLACILISTFGMIISCLRSLVSKLVETNEIGKCFAIISASETVSDLIGAITFIRLYHFGLAYGDFGRSLPFLVIAFIHSFLLIITVFLKIGMSKLTKSKSSSAEDSSGQTENGEKATDATAEISEHDSAIVSSSESGDAANGKSGSSCSSLPDAQVASVPTCSPK